MREPVQVLVILFTKEKEFKVCIFKRKVARYWQFISGGKESTDGDILDTVIREVKEETGLQFEKNNVIELETRTSIPTKYFSAKLKTDKILLTERCFAIQYDNHCAISISQEHSKFKIVSYKKANRLLKWDSNKVALYELLIKKGILKS